MKYEFWSTEEDRLIDWKELQNEKWKIKASKDGFYLLDTSREDDDGYDWEMLGEWRRFDGQ